MKDYCKVIPIKNGLLRMSGRGIKPLEPGIMLYYIWNERTNLYYKKCYVDQSYALRKAEVTTGPTSHSDIAQSWVAEPKYCKHSYRTQED